MKETKQDDIFKNMATQYMETYGKTLENELDELNEETRSQSTPVLDKAVKRKINTIKMKNYYVGFGAMAACLLLFIVVTGTRLTKSESAAPSEIAAEGNQYKLIELSFDLPENFTLSNVEQDKEKTIYYLADAYKNDVVLTVEEINTPPVFDGLKELELNDTKIYGVAKADYSMLTFEKDNLLYAMSCKYDIITLIWLSKNII